MIRFFLVSRYVLLMASIGAMAGAALMFWQGVSDLASAAHLIVQTDDRKSLTAHVMHATDAILFAIVLLFFAYAIAFGFVFDLSPEVRESLPAWMRADTVSNLKHSLIEVILVYMIVDVATDWEEYAGPLEWSSLVKPLAILVIAGALRLLERRALAAPRE
jgi:uncharacterized membrane protein YqhA